MMKNLVTPQMSAFLEMVQAGVLLKAEQDYMEQRSIEASDHGEDPDDMDLLNGFDPYEAEVEADELCEQLLDIFGELKCQMPKKLAQFFGSVPVDVQKLYVVKTA